MEQATARRALRAAIASAAVTWALAAAAQPVYRCGDSYSQKPCAGGREIAVDDTRSPAQQEASRAVVRRDAQAADAMERERLGQEARAAASARQAASAPQKKKGAQPEVSTKLKPPVPVKPIKPIQPLGAGKEKQPASPAKPAARAGTGKAS